MRYALALALMLFSLGARDRAVSRSTTLRFAPAAVGDAPIWPIGGVHIRTALAAAQAQGAPAITEPWRAQWRITWISRDDIPTLTSNPVWHSFDPRYSGGVYQTRVWMRRYFPPVTHSSSAYYGYWCETLSLSVPALGANQSHFIALPTSTTIDDVIDVEARLGLLHWIDVQVVSGGPWYRVGGGWLGEHGIGIPNASPSTFQIGEPSYARCD